MTYKVINQYGNFIDGKHRLEIIKTYLLDLEEAFFEDGSAEIVGIVNKPTSTTIEVIVHIKEGKDYEKNMLKL